MKYHTLNELLVLVHNISFIDKIKIRKKERGVPVGKQPVKASGPPGD